LFDAVAALCGLRQMSRFEGQAAMDLEFAAGDASSAAPFPFRIERTATGLRVMDWEPMLIALASTQKPRQALGELAARFHVTLAEMIIAVAREIGEERVVLTGGCFQNRLLTELAVTRLSAAGFKPFWHQRVPPNDGGIALGQVVAARRTTA
jgi:hydrogenase maturation protein HypF